MGWKEDLFTWVIQSFAGKYIKDISKDKLSISLYNGEARIEDMSLRDDVIEALLGVPVSVTESNVSSISIKIPSWTNITSVHVELCVNDVFAVVTPKKSHFKVNDEDKYREKMRQVGIYEANGEATKEETPKPSLEKSDPTYDSSDTTKDNDNTSWYQRIGLTVLNNAVIKVKNVHLRYEDFMESSGKHWGFGAIIKDIELISTNPAWEEAIVNHDPNSPKFKMGKIDSFSLYWDYDIESSKVSSISEKESFYKTMLEMITSSKHNYIIEPLTTIIKFKVNPRKSQLPKYECFIDMNTFKIGISKEQYIQSMDFLSLLYSYFRDIKIDTKVVRPACTVKENPRQWWKYAYDRIAERIHKERRPDFFTLRHEYIKTYAKKQLDEKSLTKAEATRLEDIQHILTKEDIILFRYVANRRVKLNAQKKKEETKNTGWFGWLTGSNASSSAIIDPTKLTFIQDLGVKMSEKDIDEFAGFVNALKSDFNDNDEGDEDNDLSSDNNEEEEGEEGGDSGPRRKKGERRMFYVHVGLDKASLELSKEGAEMYSLNFMKIAGTFENFIFSKGWNFTFGVKEATIENHTRKSGDSGAESPGLQQPILMLKNRTIDNNFKFVVQSFPAEHPGCDFYVKVLIMPVQIAVEKAIVHNIADFFTLPSNIDTRYLTISTESEEKELSEAKIAQLAKQSIKTKVEASLYEPTIIYRLEDKRKKGEFTNLIFVAKSLNVFTMEGPDEDRADSGAPDFYDRASFSLNNAELLINKNTPGADAETLVDSFTISGSVGKCKLPPNPKYPQFAVSTSITPICFEITDNVFSDLLDLIPKTDKDDDNNNERRLLRIEKRPVVKKASVDVSIAKVDVNLVYRGAKLVKAYGTGISCGVQVGTDGVDVDVGVKSGKVLNLVRDTTPILDETPLAVKVSVGPGKPLSVGVDLKSRVLVTLDIGVLCSILAFFQINTKPSKPPEVLIKHPLLSMSIDVRASMGGKVRFLLYDQTAELVGILGSSLNVNVTVRRLGFSVSGSVAGFTAVVEEGNDLLVKSPKYKEILSSSAEGGCALNFAFDSFSPHETAVTYPGYTYLLKIATETEVRFVFLMNFIINVLGNVMKIVDNAPRPPPVPDSPESKFVVDISAARPSIVIPRSSESEDYFLIKVREAFTLFSKYDDEKGVCNYNFDVGTVDVVNDAGALAGTVADLDFVYRMPTSTVGITPFWELEFRSAGTLDLKLNRTRYNNLISMVWENFCESVNRVTPGPRPPPVPSRSLCTFTVEKGIRFGLQEPEKDSDYIVITSDKVFVSFESLFQKVLMTARLDNLSSHWRNACGELDTLIDTSGTTVYKQENTYTPETVEMNMDLDCFFTLVSPWYDPIKFAYGFLFPDQRTFDAMNKDNEYPNRETSYSLKMATRTLEVPLTHANRNFARVKVTGCNGATDDFKLLYMPKGAGEGEVIEILSFKEDNEPASCFVDYRGKEGLSLKARLDKLRAVHNLDLFEEMILFSSEVSETTTSELSTQATEIAEKTVTPATYFLDIVLEAPYIVVPGNKTHSKLEWDMGQISAKTLDDAGKKIAFALDQVSLKLNGRTLLTDVGISANAELEPLKADVVVKDFAMSLEKSEIALLQDVIASVVPAQKPPQDSLPEPQPLPPVEKANPQPREAKLRSRESKKRGVVASQRPAAEPKKGAEGGLAYSFTLKAESLSLLAVDTTKFGLTSISLAVKSSGNGAIDAVFSTQNVYVEDVRPDAIEKSKFRRILFLDDSPETASDTHINFNGKYEVDDNNCQCITGELSLMTPTFYFIPDAIKATVDFFMTADGSSDGKGEKKKSKKEKDASEKQRTKADGNSKKEEKKEEEEEDEDGELEKKEKSLYSVRMRCLFKGSVILPEDVADSNTQLMILDLDVDSDVHEKTDLQAQGFLNVRGFSLCTCLAEHRESTKVFIMRSCLLNLAMTRNYMDDTNFFVVNFQEPVTIVLTYNNIKLILLPFTRLFKKSEADNGSSAKLLGKGDSKQLIEGNADLLPEDNAGKLPESSSDLLSEENNGIPGNNEQVVASDAKQESTSGLNISVLVKRYEVILINDISGENLPVLSSSFGASINWIVPSAAAAAADRSAPKEETSLLGEIAINAKIYDWALSEWVPFIENWRINMTYTLAQRTLKGISVYASKPLVLTVAASSVKVLKSLVETVNSEYESYLKNPDGTITRKRFVPYIFVNETGLEVMIKLADTFFLIEPGESKPFYDDLIRDELKLDENSDIPHECLISWQSDEMMITINKEGFFSGSNLAARVTVEENGRKKIVLRSQFVVRNISQNTIALGVHMGSKIVGVGTAGPGGELAVPLEYFEEKTGTPLFIALVMGEKGNSEKVMWSMPFYIFDREVNNFVVQDDKQIPVTYTDEAGHVKTRTYCINVEITKTEKYVPRHHRFGSTCGTSRYKDCDDSYREAFTFVVGPPLVLVNELPIPVRCRWPGMAQEKVLNPNESVHFYNSTKEGEGCQRIALNLEEMYKTKWVEDVLTHEVNFKSSATGKTITSARVVMEKESKKGAKRVARIKASYWIVNETKNVLSLSYDMQNEFPLLPDAVFPVWQDYAFFRCLDVPEPCGVSFRDFMDKKTVDFIFLKGKDASYDFVLKGSYWDNGPISKKVIRIRPRFVFINETEESIFCHFLPAKDAKDAKGIRVAEQVVWPNTRRPIQRNSKHDDPFTILLRVGKSGAPTAISLTTVDSFPLRACVGKGSFRIFDVDVDIKKEITVLRIRTSPTPRMAIENRLSYDIPIFQECAAGDYSGGIVVPRKSSVPFGWNFPAAARRISFMKTSSKKMFFEVSRLGNVSSYPLNTGECIVVNVSLRQNPSGGRATRVVKIEIEKQATPLTESGDSEDFEVIGSDDDDGFETKKDAKKKESGIEYRFSIREIGISVINNVPEEIMYVSIGGVESLYSQCGKLTRASLKIERLQVDNQLNDSSKMFPSIVHRVNSERPGMGIPYFFNVFVELKSAGESYIKSLFFDITPFAVNAEERFLSYFEKTFLSAFSSPSLPAARTLTNPAAASIGSTSAARRDMASIDPEATARMTYIESLIMGGLKFSLTFIPATSNSDKLMSAWWYKAFGSIARLENCMLTFDPFCVSDIYASPGVIAKRLTNFYKAEVKRKLVSVIFSISLIGNPVGFFREVRTGVDCLKDSRGVKGFFSHTTAGAVNSISSVASSVNTGLRKISGDTRQKNASNPKNFGKGVIGGLASIGNGIENGFTGLVKAPINGSKKGGVAGFFKGLGQGVVGVVAQPVAGVFDAVSTVNKGISTSLTGRNVSALHPQRIITRRVITPYDFDMYYYYGALKKRVSKYEILRSGSSKLDLTFTLVEDVEKSVCFVQHTPDYKEFSVRWKYSLEERKRMPNFTNMVVDKVRSMGINNPDVLRNVSTMISGQSNMMAVTPYKKRK